MKQDFEEMMNRKMEEGDVHDVYPAFDRDIAWKEIEGRIPQKKRKVFALGWSHAAALLIGIIISALLFKLFTNSNPEINKVVVNHTDTIINTITLRDTVAVPQQVMVKAPVQKIKPAVIQKPEVISSPIHQQVEQVAVVKEEPLVAQQEVEIPKPVAKKKTTVVHLLDIENEDRNTALYHNDPSASQRSGFAIQISAKRLPESRNAEQSSVLTDFFKH